jgi:hypothetical protein
MTKTFTPVVALRSADSDLPVKMPLDITVYGPIVWNFEIGSLGFV